MEQAAVVEQLAIFVQNVCEVSALVKQLYNSGFSQQDATNSSLQQIVCTKIDLLNTIVMLNKMLVSTLHCIYPGSLILAPRLYRGSICWDFAVVVCIEKVCPPGESGLLTHSEQPEILSGLDMADINANFECTVSTLWLHPHTGHEFLATRVSFMPSQLRDTQSALHLWQEQEQALSLIQAHTEVLYLSTDWEIPGADNRITGGQWLSAKVISVDTHTDTGSTVTILPSAWRGQSSLLTRTRTVPLQMAEVCCPPRPAAARVPSSSKLSRHGGTGNSNSGSDCDSQSDGEDSVHDGITQLPSYLQQQRIKYASSSGSLSNMAAISKAGGLQGGWEVHTKGFGSKILAKMGFKKNSGGGLGKHLQGIAAPVEGLVKALPAGLSLDYISEVCKRSPHGSRSDLSLPMTAGDALAAKEKEIKLDIVARFNAAQQPGAKAKQKVHKSSTRPVQKVPEPDMFGFLNKLESKQQGTHASNATGTSNSSMHKSSSIGDLKKPTSNTKDFSASKIF